MNSFHNNNVLNIKDRHYVLGWSLSDESKIQRYTEKCKAFYGKPEHQAEYSKLADLMIELVEKRNNDHHNTTAELGHDWLNVEPINNPSFEPDMVTMAGLNKMLKIYTATASGVFKYIGHGSSAITPNPYLTTLGGAEDGTRLDCTTQGFQDVKGVSLRLFAAYASTVATTTIRTVGLFDASTNGLMLALHNFGSLAFVHTANSDAFSLGMILDFVPFGDV